jgi:hypothetical protein
MHLFAFIILHFALTSAFALMPLAAQAQMPDLRQMAGVPLPSADLPSGTVSVRVVRGALTNAVAGQRVEIVGGQAPLVAATDGSGRATFAEVPSGTSLQAVTTVDGERLTSQAFSLPAQGGVRLILAAGLASTSPEAATARGSVTLGPESRLVVELGENVVDVFVVMDLLNAQGVPVTPAPPLVIQMPDGITGASVMESSTARAAIQGREVTVQPPVAPGKSTLELAYRLRYSGDTLRFAQALPLALPQLNVAVRSVGDMSVSVSGETARREVASNGRRYVVVSGPARPAGAAVDVVLGRLPAHPRWPRYLALGLAGAIVLGGLIAMRRAADRDAPSDVSRAGSAV